MTLRTDNTACLIVDIQERLTPALHEAERFTAACTLLIQGLHALGIPMMATEQYPQGLGTTLPEIKSLLPDTPFVEKPASPPSCPKPKTSSAGTTRKTSSSSARKPTSACCKPHSTCARKD